MKQPYNQPQRESSDQGGSTRHSINYIQDGIAVSSINTAYTFIPCGITHPAHVWITPVLEGRSTGDIANGTALFTTTVGWYISALANNLLSAVADVDDWVSGAAYKVGQVALDPDDDTAFICIVDHTASATNTQAGFEADVALGYWQELPEDMKFIKIIHTAAGSGDWAQFNYRIVGVNS